MSEAQQKADRFSQAGWSAETVNQTVNNYPDLSRLTTEEKVDLIARKIIGSPWYNEPGIIPTLAKLEANQEQTKHERLLLFRAIGIIAMVAVLVLLVQLFMLVDLYFR